MIPCFKTSLLCLSIVLPICLKSQVSIEADKEIKPKRSGSKGLHYTEEVSSHYFYEGDEITIYFSATPNAGESEQSVTINVHRLDLNFNSPVTVKPSVSPPSSGEKVLSLEGFKSQHKSFKVPSSAAYSIKIVPRGVENGNIKVIRKAGKAENAYSPTIYLWRAHSYYAEGETRPSYATTELDGKFLKEKIRKIEENPEARTLFSNPLNKDHIEAFLKYGAGISDRDKKGMTLLHYAARAGDYELTDYLLGKKIDPALKDNAGKTALHYLKKGDGSVKLAGLLHVHGASFTAADSQGHSPVHYALENGDARLARFYLERIDPKDKTESFLNPLLFSAFFPDPDLIKLLIESGANPHTKHTKPYSGESITLWDLFSFEDTDTVNFPLFRLLADKNVTVTNHRLVYLAEKRPEILPVLLRAGLDLNHPPGGYTPLHGVARNDGLEPGDKAFLSLLLRSGANVNAKDEGGETPLHYAVVNLKGNEIFDTLVKYGARPSEKDTMGNTPLHITYADFIPQLVLMGAPVNEKNVGGETPLHVFVKEENVNGVRLLLAAGASPDIKDKQGESPADLARKLGNKEILELFK